MYSKKKWCSLWQLCCQGRYWLGKISVCLGPGSNMNLKHGHNSWPAVCLEGQDKYVHSTVAQVCIFKKKLLYTSHCSTCDSRDEYWFCLATGKEETLSLFPSFPFCLAIINLPGLPVWRGHCQTVRDNQKGPCLVLSCCVSLIYLWLPLVLPSSLISVPIGEGQ